ncbi:MAG TPA: epoxyqueuosine reductase QueH [Candidatus Coprenecus pullistercoris]|nr:epoxyqueuosine reductase QueH [Candidatus Coprenecus pullistercoris]
MEKVLLHSCCAPCSAAILEWMGQNGYEPTILFYNPNIFPEEEYLKRKNEIVRYAQEIGVAIVDLDGGNAEIRSGRELTAGMTEPGNAEEQQGAAGDFWEQQHTQWLKCTVGLENEPERGGRCLACFKHRLCTAASYAADYGFPLFTTTLASSRWKDIRQINEAGFYAEEHCGRSLTRFWDRNWRKGGLYERRNILARQFYNQQYCGCEFSLAHRNHSSDTIN